LTGAKIRTIFYSATYFPRFFSHEQILAEKQLHSFLQTGISRSRKHVKTYLHKLFFAPNIAYLKK
jgi:hypothetical protein